MADDIQIPLSTLNAIPTVAGLQDVEFSIPDQQDIEEVVDEQTSDPEDLLSVTQQGVQELSAQQILIENGGGDDDDPVGPAEQLEIVFSGLFGPTQGDLVDVADLISDALGDPLEGDDGLPQQLAATLDTSFEDRRPFGDVTINDLDLGQLEQLARGEVTDPEISQQAALNRILAAADTIPDRFGLDTTQAQQLVESLNDDGIISDGRLAQVPGAVTPDGIGVPDVFEIVQDLAALSIAGGASLADDPLGFFEDVFSAVLPEINGVSVLSDPAGFAVELGVEISELVVSEQSRENLFDAVDEFSAPLDQGA
jgi:hypothetical protein